MVKVLAEFTKWLCQRQDSHTDRPSSVLLAVLINIHTQISLNATMDSHQIQSRKSPFYKSRGKKLKHALLLFKLKNKKELKYALLFI